MPAARQPDLKPGRVYRTREFARWSANPTRFAQRLVRDGVLQPLASGLYVHPRKSRFGDVPPTTEELLRGFLEGSPYVITGPERWNPLGLGTTAVLPVTLVYNTKRSGEIELGNRRFLFRRVAFLSGNTEEASGVHNIDEPSPRCLKRPKMKIVYVVVGSLSSGAITLAATPFSSPGEASPDPQLLAV